MLVGCNRWRPRVLFETQSSINSAIKPFPSPITSGGTKRPKQRVRGQSQSYRSIRKSTRMAHANVHTMSGAGQCCSIIHGLVFSILRYYYIMLHHTALGGRSERVNISDPSASWREQYACALLALNSISRRQEPSIQIQIVMVH